MKQMNKVIAAILAVVMLCSCCFTAGATDGGEEPGDTQEKSITITFKEGNSVISNETYSLGDNESVDIKIPRLDKTGDNSNRDYENWKWEDENHQFSKTATEDTVYTLVPVTDEDEHKHQFNESTVDSNCTEKGYTLHTCDCGYQYADLFQDLAKHTPAEAVRENEVAATCTEAGSYDEVVYCSVCNAEISRTTVKINALNHDITGVKWSSDKDNHWKVCTRDAEHQVNKEKHQFSEWSKGENNTHKRVCSVCGYEEIGEHAYTAVVTQPDCENAGYTTYTCSVCNDSYIGDNKEALGHDWGNWKLKSTCTPLERECKRNPEHTQTLEFDGKIHTPAKAVKENEVAATCTKTGSYDEVVYCSVCQEELSRTEKTITALGHKYQFHHVDWSTLDKKNQKVTIVEICGVCKDEPSHERKRTVKVSVSTSINKDVYTLKEKWSSVVTLTYAYGGEKKAVNLSTKDYTLKGFSTKKSALKMACSIQYAGNTYKLPNIMAVKERYLFGARSASNAPYYEYLLANSKAQKTTARVLVSKSGITLKFLYLLNNRSTEPSPKLKSDFSYTTKYDKSTGYTYITLKPKATFKKAGTGSDYQLTLSGRDGSKTYTITIVFNAYPNVKLTAQSKAFTASWAKTNLATGYVVKYSARKDMKKAKTVTVKGQYATSKKISKLSSKKAYYVQVRSYHKVGKNYFYSEWSPVKSIKTK